MNDMGAKEPIFSSSSSNKSNPQRTNQHHHATTVKSTSIETGDTGFTGSAINLSGGQDDSEVSSTESSSENNDQQQSRPNHHHHHHHHHHYHHQNNQHTQKQHHSSQQQQHRLNQRQATIIGNPLISSKNVKKQLTLSPSGGAMLKPSASISCLPTAVSASDSNDPTSDSTSALVSSLPTRASLTHEWKKLKTPNKCRECNLLVYFNGRECSFCGFIAHKKCVPILVIKCSGQQVVANKNRKQSHCQCSSHIAKSHKTTKSNSSQVVKPIFGQPIGQLDGHQVVDFIRRFIYEIDTRGLTSKGIYRVSSIKSKVDRLCNYYDQNMSSLVDLTSFHPIIIANALKMYLRQLPEPLMTQELYDSFIQIAKKYPNTTASKQASTSTTSGSNENKSISPQSNNTNNKPITPSPPKYRRPYSVSLLSSTTNALNNDPSYNPMLIVELTEVMELLPPINRELVAIIMRHLKRVASMSHENQMSATNLSIIFGPTLLSNANNKSQAIVDNIHQARVVELMITWADQMFPQYENYESKTVIELAENQQEVFRNVQDKSDINNHQQQQNLIGKIRQATFKDGRKVKNDNNNNNNNNININNNNNNKQETKVDDPSIKTRKDLGELRRQFFTVPAVQTNLVMTDICSGFSSPKALQLESPTRASRADDDCPGSVPLIKVQPFFCDKLTKYQPERRS